MLTWLQLLRLPTVFTAMADILCGFFLAAMASPDPPNWTVLPCLLLSSACLYLGGMVLNDVFDARLDAIERPERPIPSGRIALRSAAGLGACLMFSGLMASAAAWIFADRVGHSLVTAGLVAIVVLAYDAVLKSTWAGPFGMACCRFLNLSLGASTALNPAGQVAAWHLPTVGASLGLAVYIVGVTWFARHEAGNAARSGLIGGLVITALGIVASGASTLWSQSNRSIVLIAGLQFAIILAVTIARGVTAIRNGESPVLQRTVGKMLLWIIVLDSAVVFAVTGDIVQQCIILCLVVPAIMLRKRIAMS